MIRTRDFFLFVTIVVFLLVGIGNTVMRNGVSTEMSLPVLNGAAEEGALSAQVGTRSVDRDARLAILREKIAAGTTLYSQDTFFEPDEISTSSDEVVLSTTVSLCPGYSPYVGFWDLRQITVTLEGGTRVATLRTTVATSTEEQVLLRLPTPTLAQGGENCLRTDVIGITPAGALLRNSDAIFYRGVNDSVLLGYALDGYPIYGTGTGPSDTCGGVTVNGQYQYVLSAERDTMINCFSGLPAVI